MVKTVDISGFPHAYELSPPTGAATVLVFVHGWLLSRHYWQPVIERLSSTYQCLTYDLRGFGESQQRMSEPIAPAALQTAVVGFTGQSFQPTSLEFSTAAPASPSLYTPAAYAEDLLRLLRHLKIQRAWLVGHSLGGSISLWAADRAPDAIEGVICVNSGGGIYLKEDFERFRTAGQQLLKLRPRWLSYLPLLDLALTRMNVARPLDRRWGKQRLVDLLAAEATAARGTLLDSTTEAEVHQLPKLIAQLQQPVHFIAGARDTVMEPKYVNHLASFHPLFECCGNNVSEIPDCGHLSMVEQPAAVAEEIRSVLAKY